MHRLFKALAVFQVFPYVANAQIAQSAQNAPILDAFNVPDVFPNSKKN